MLLNAVQKLAKNECANFSGKNGCYLRDCCVYFEDVIYNHCSYFIESVLPMDQELKSEYMQAASMGLSINGDVCEICGHKFNRNNNKQKYCQRCASNMKRKYDREYQEKMRGIS